ncbi:MAG: prolyl oligopeptidase family serine peptidase [Planctomycetota bacterium]|jgi:prolyl oligopeptidase
MARRVVLGVFILALVAGCKGRRQRKASARGLAYPATRTVAHADEYHGTRVEDPYRWLEDADSAETRAWIEAQNKLTFSYLERLPARKRIRERFEQLMDYERYQVPFRRGDRYFYKRNDGLQDQDILYWAERLDAEPRVLLDPNGLSEDGTVALADTDVSPDGQLLAYAISRAGSDWREIKVREVETGEDLPADHLRWIKFSGASWKADSTGFFYSRLPAPEPGRELSAINRLPKVYYHEVGRPQEHDALVYERPDQPGWSLLPWVSDDGRYLIIYVGKGSATENGIFYLDLEADGPVVELLDRFDATYWPIGNEGPVWWVVTDLKAPKRRIVALDLRHPEREAWRELVPEAEHAIEDVRVVGDRFLVHYLRRAHSRLRLFRLDGARDRDIELPTLGTAFGFTGRPTQREAFFGFSSFTVPRTIYRYDLDARRLAVFRRPQVDVDTDRFVVKQVAYHGQDGTPVTMFITHKRSLALDGANPTLLQGYGGFSVSVTPFYSTRNVVWMEMGGVFAVPNLRGGGEYGKQWHRAGIREKKQNVFDDFIAAAERLIHNRYTRASRLAIAGASNGGLLVGACMTQRPGLFAACLPAVGVMDMLRFHRFTIGWAWVGELGSSDDPEMFKVLHAYSPYHRLHEGVRYPATLVTTADHDDRVVPAHSYKFTARLQACQGGPAPVLIRVETKAGHGAGTPISKQIDLAADRLAFLAENLQMRVRGRFWKRR